MAKGDKSGQESFPKRLRKVKRAGSTNREAQKERPVRRPTHLGELVAGDGPQVRRKFQAVLRA